MLGALVAALVAALCVLSSWRRLATLRRAPGGQLEAALGGRRVRSRDFAQDLLVRLEAGAVRDALTDALAAGEERAVVAALNELGLELREELEVGSQIPRSAARVSLATGTLVGVVTLASSLGGSGPVALPQAVAAFVAGAAGAGVCAELGRRAESLTRRRREGANVAIRDLAQVLGVPDLPPRDR